VEVSAIFSLLCYLVGYMQKNLKKNKEKKSTLLLLMLMHALSLSIKKNIKFWPLNFWPLNILK